MNKNKKRVFDIIQIGQSRDIASKAFDYVLVLVIVVNILVMVLETFESLAGYMKMFEIIEIVCILFFAMEYVLRIWTSDLLYTGVSKGRAAANFIFSFDGIVEGINGKAVRSTTPRMARLTSAPSGSKATT